jgi:two-component system, OmpR family, response regulator ChvI
MRARALQKNRILVVDDEPDITLTLKMALQVNGFVVDTYNDPLLVLSIFKANSYDLLLIDINMPEINGFELYTKLQQIDQKVKICFITAFDHLYYEEFTRIFPKINVNCFVRKPVTINALARVIKAELQP